MIRRRYPRFYKGLLKTALKLFASGNISNGKCIAEFEISFAQYIGSRFASVTCSGRNGLDLLLDAYNIQTGDEILIPAYTLKDLVYLIESKGIKPKLVDIENDSFNLNPDLINKAITPKTKAILATHLFGLPCNIEKIVKIAKEHKLIVIEDCAHSLGSLYKNKKTGSFGDAGFFSFEIIKSINTFGGGMISTNDPVIYSAVKKKAQTYPFNNKELFKKIVFAYFEHFLINSPVYLLLLRFFMYPLTAKLISKTYLYLHKKTRLEYSAYTNLQALMGLAQLRNIDKNNEKRIFIAGELSKRLNMNVFPQKIGNEMKHNYYFYVAKLRTKLKIESVRNMLIKKGIDSGIKSEITDNCAAAKEGNIFPSVQEVYEHSLQLPMYDDLDKYKIENIAEAVNEICKQPYR